MNWCSFEYPPTRDDLIDDAERLHADWYAVRVGTEAIQGGFCAPVGGKTRPKKLHSLAALLADSREQPWLGIFKLEEGLWWYIAVRDGHAILPDGDIIGGEDEVRAAQQRHSGYVDWRYVQGDRDLLMAMMAKVSEKPPVVKSLTAKGLPPQATAGVLAGLIGLGAAGAYYMYSARVKELEEIARQRAIAIARTQAPPPLPSPLKTTPTPNTWLAACRTVMWPLPLSKNGWRLDTASCAGSAATALWVRAPGATVEHRPNGDLSPDGETVTEILPLSKLDFGDEREAQGLREAEAKLRAWAQKAQFGLRITGATAAPQAKDQPQPVPQAAVHLEMPISVLMQDFSGIPGLRLNSIKASTTGWSVDGVLYGKQ